MHRYSVYGTMLASELEFLEFEPAEGEQRESGWKLIRDPGVPEPPGPLLGSEQLGGDVTVRRFGTGNRLTLEVADVGAFAIDVLARVIHWFPGPHDCEDCARFLVVTRVLPFAMQISGTLMLHGSAVVIGDSAAVFVGRKFAGKSTLARALMEAGAVLASDDCVPVTPGSTPVMQRGLAHHRLRQDSASHFEAVADRIGERAGKYVFGNVRAREGISSPVSIGGVYVLHPVPWEEGRAPAVRRRLDRSEAAFHLLQHNRVAALLTAPEQVCCLSTAGDLAAAVPVHRLEVARDYGSLEEVAATILEWHRPATVAAAT
jgi:hypothetical protein